MKKFLLFAMAFVAVISLTACGDDSSDNNNNNNSENQNQNVVPTQGVVIEMRKTFPAEGFTGEIVLDSITVQPTVFTAGDNWAKLYIMPYESGSAKATLTVEPNTASQPRSTMFVLTANADTLKLTIAQQAAAISEVDNTDSTTNEVTDQPAYSRAK